MKTLNRLLFPKFQWAMNPSPNSIVISKKRDSFIELTGTYPPHSSWSTKAENTPSGSAETESGHGSASLTHEQETERETLVAAGNAFLRCMVEVMAATLCSFACVATAFCGHYLAAGLIGFLASILWRSALREGREAARLFAECPDEDI